MSIPQDKLSVWLAGDLPENWIADFERRYAIAIPATWVDLISNNYQASLNEPNQISIPESSSDSTVAEQLLSFNEYGLAHYMEEYHLYLPTGMLPIIADPGGSFFSMQTKGEDKDKIYYIDIENGYEMNGSINYPIHFIANSIENFIDKLS